MYFIVFKGKKKPEIGHIVLDPKLKINLKKID